MTGTPRRIPPRLGSLIAFVLLASLDLLPVSGTSQAATPPPGSRKGLLFGFGMGGGIPMFRLEDGSDTEIRGGLATALRFGLGITEKIEVFLFSDGVTAFEFYWIPIPITTSVSGIGGRYYFPSATPGTALYAGAGVGLAAGSVLVPFGSGLGVTAEGGYQFGSHWTAGLQLAWLNLVDSNQVDSDTGEEIVWGSGFSIAGRIGFTIY